MEEKEFNKIKAMTDAYLDRQLDNLPSEEEIAKYQVLSDRFLRRMDRLVRKARRKQSKFNGEATISQSKPKYKIRKRLLVVAIICSILASAVSVYANREVVVDFIIQVFETFTSIMFQTSTKPSVTITGEDQSNNIANHLPTSIPKGYKTVDRIITSSLVEIIYANKSGAELIFDKMMKDGTQMGLDTEGIELEKLTVNGYSGVFFTKNGQSSLVWADDSYAYSIIGVINKDEMMNLAISTK